MENKHALQLQAHSLSVADANPSGAQVNYSGIPFESRACAWLLSLQWCYLQQGTSFGISLVSTGPGSSPYTHINFVSLNHSLFLFLNLDDSFEFLVNL